MNHCLVLNADMSPQDIVPKLSVWCWQDAIRSIWSGKFVTVSAYSDWSVHSPSVTMAVPAIIMSTHYNAPKLYHGYSDDLICLRDNFTCQYCGEIFSESRLTMDHVVPRSLGGKTCWENIVAACGPCNMRKANHSRMKPMQAPFKPTVYELIERKKRQHVVVPHEAWLDYLDWNPDLVSVIKPKIK